MGKDSVFFADITVIEYRLFAEGYCQFEFPASREGIPLP